jgi:hypothetical protein
MICNPSMPRSANINIPFGVTVHPVILLQIRSFKMLQSKLSAVKLYASDLQTFLGGRTMLREVEEEEICVSTLLEDKCLQQVNLCYRPEAKKAAISCPL